MHATQLIEAFTAPKLLKSLTSSRSLDVMAESNGIQMTQPRIAPGISPKRKPVDGKDALLTEKPPPLESRVSSPHKNDRGFCGYAVAPNAHAWRA